MNIGKYENVCIYSHFSDFSNFHTYTCFTNFRLVLKCRSRARKQFAALRSDVLVKLELLDNKHFQDMVFQLKRLLEGLAKFHVQTQQIVSQEKLFPIEVDWEPPSINSTEEDQIE